MGLYQNGSEKSREMFGRALATQNVVQEMDCYSKGSMIIKNYFMKEVKKVDGRRDKGILGQNIAGISV